MSILEQSKQVSWIDRLHLKYFQLNYTYNDASRWEEKNLMSLDCVKIQYKQKKNALAYVYDERNCLASDRTHGEHIII